MNSLWMELADTEQFEVSGGAAAGALVGAIFGGCISLTVWAVAGCQGGGNGAWKAYTAGALTGAAIGLYTPI